MLFKHVIANGQLKGRGLALGVWRLLYTTLMRGSGSRCVCNKGGSHLVREPLEVSGCNRDFGTTVQ